jgi:preprotein translocase subunit SecB
MTEARAPEAQFTLERIYIKDISYEAPAAPQALFQNVTPQIELQLSVQHTVLNADEGMYEVVVAVQVSAKAQDKALFLVELQQGGLFRVKGVTGEPLQQALQIACPNILLPFVREAISDLVGKGGFPPLLIQPINFETLYHNRKRVEATPAGHA